MKNLSLAPSGVDDPLQDGLIPRELLWGIAAGDWDILFDAVKARLRSAAEAAPVTPLQVIVLDCATALDCLHAALKEARGQDVQTPPLPGRADDAADPC